MTEQEIIAKISRSPCHKKRVQGALAETERHIAREEGYSKDLQKTEYLESLKKHKQKLQRILAAA